MSENNAALQAALLEEGSIQSLGKDELVRVQEALAIYRSGQPPIVEKQVSFLGEHYFETGVLLAAAGGAITLSALRVGLTLLASELNLSVLYTKTAGAAPPQGPPECSTRVDHDGWVVWLRNLPSRRRLA